MRNSCPGRETIDVSGMGRPPAFLPIAVGVMVIAGCDGASQCVHPSIYDADEAPCSLHVDRPRRPGVARVCCRTSASFAAPPLPPPPLNAIVVRQTAMDVGLRQRIV